MDKLLKIYNANLNERLCKLEEKDKIYIDEQYIRQAIEEYVAKYKVEINPAMLSEKKYMLHFINIEMIKFMRSNADKLE